MPRILTIIVCILALAAGGCASFSVVRGTTTGQELVDLDKARAAGAVTDAEYTAIRARLSAVDRP